jgi:5-dehydro-2-deoxygluconokinase
MVEQVFDVVSLGRAAIDFYAREIGRPLPEVESFNWYVGGCPANIIVGCARLGLRTAMVSRVDNLDTGQFVVDYLAREGVETRYIARDQLHRTGLAVLSIQPPDRFPLVFFRENCADLFLDVADIPVEVIGNSRILVASGTALSSRPSQAATLLALETARRAGQRTILDSDYRPVAWPNPTVTGLVTRRALSLVDVVIGTEQEVKVVGGSDGLETCIERIMAEGVETLVLKRGEAGCTIISAEGARVEVPSFPVEVLNLIGAGDGFAAGFIFGYLQGWDWYRVGRYANAVGAIVVTRHGCASAMPTPAEVSEFMARYG